MARWKHNRLLVRRKRLEWRTPFGAPPPPPPAPRDVSSAALRVPGARGCWGPEALTGSLPADPAQLHAAGAESLAALLQQERSKMAEYPTPRQVPPLSPQLSQLLPSLLPPACILERVGVGCLTRIQ